MEEEVSGGAPPDRWPGARPSTPDTFGTENESRQKVGGIILRAWDMPYLDVKHGKIHSPAAFAWGKLRYTLMQEISCGIVVGENYKLRVVLYYLLPSFASPGFPPATGPCCPGRIISQGILLVTIQPDSRGISLRPIGSSINIGKMALNRPIATLTPIPSQVLSPG